MNALLQSTPHHSTHKEVDMITHRYSRVVRLRALAALLGALSALLLVAGVAPADASHVRCGAILGPGTHVLESDLECTFFPALTLNSAALDLNGFTVRCASSIGTTMGIAVQGSESWLGNGVVENCTYGVVLAGSGGHTVTAVLAIGNGNGDGFNIGPKSKKNSLITNAAMNNYNGFAVLGKDNCLTANAASLNFNGFVVRPSGSKNRLNNNGALKNEDDGFDIEGNDNVVAGNRASENGGDGIDVAGQKNLLTGNIADKNFEAGLEAQGSSNLFYGNMAGPLNRGAGFEVRGSKNKLTGNMADSNLAGGFLVSGSQNALVANRSGENDGPGFRIVGGKNSIDGSFAANNGGNGFEGYGAKNSFTDGVAGENGDNGIVLAFGAAQNYVGQNTVSGHPGYDLKDENSFCSNEWFHNSSESSFQICD
jgi:parallel beta-helix repeat protein